MKHAKEPQNMSRLEIQKKKKRIIIKAKEEI